MPEKPKTRPLSASRKRRQRNRRSSLNSDRRPSEPILHPYPSSPNAGIFDYGIDRRTTKEKIESLEKQMKSPVDDLTPEEHLDSLVLLQLYTSMEYGEKSIENARAYLNLSKFYFHRRNLLPQAKSHILKARQIFEQLNVELIDDHLTPNLLAFEIYSLLIKYSFRAKQHSSQREIKTKNKHILSINTSYIDRDLHLLYEHLEKLKHIMNTSEYDEKYMEYLSLKFDIITSNLREFNQAIFELFKEIIAHLNEKPSDNQMKTKIDIYLRYGYYLVNFEEYISKGLGYYKEAVEFAEEKEKNEPSDAHRYQLADALFQWGKARVRADRLTNNTENKFKRAMKIYKEINDENDTNIFKIIDELATFYTKVESFQEALRILCDSLFDKKRLLGDFSEEVIQTESRIGAIYLRECEYINATEHLKECLDLQEFVYGPKDPRTCQTRDALEILKKDPKVSREFFSRTQEGIRKDRPAFRLSNKVSHEKEDYQLLLTATKKPPISSKN